MKKYGKKLSTRKYNKGKGAKAKKVPSVPMKPKGLQKPGAGIF